MGGMKGDDKATRFFELTEHCFRFLEDEHALKRVNKPTEGHYQSVEYSSPAVYVCVGYDMYSACVEISIRPSKSSNRRKYFDDILRDDGVKPNHTSFQASTLERLDEWIPKIAALFQQHAAKYLTVDQPPSHDQSLGF